MNGMNSQDPKGVVRFPEVNAAAKKGSINHGMGTLLG